MYVSKARFCDPDINPSYQQWTEHYQVANLPARPRKPRDSAVQAEADCRIQ